MSLISQFQSRFELLKGHVHLVTDEAAAARTAYDICRATSASVAALAQLHAPFVEEFARLCSTSDIELVTPPYDHADLPGVIDRAQVGIAAAEYAIAQTGTLIEFTADDSSRLVSSLPRTYIGIVPADRVVSRLDDAAPLIREFFHTHDRDGVVSFISGPSRTGDIELILTLGVHGPEQAHAIVIGPGA